ncbi:MAG: hypothetical protein CME69_11510 [Halobacteriovorax sp.]|nr:hypothetical protein [Halobacteriovorax sp.]
MRRNSIRNRGVRRKSKVLDIDITSLLDILVILLVFLIKSYDATGVIFKISEEITLPTSQSQARNTTGVVVQVSPQKIWIDDEEIVNQDTKRAIRGGIVQPLYDQLVAKKNDIKMIQNNVEGAKKFTGLVNLVIDKTLKYNYVKTIMRTCAEAGYSKYKFIVRGVEE